MMTYFKSLAKTPLSEILYRYFIWRARPLEITTKNSLLVIAPHPDDESFGCGALIAQHPNTHIVVVTDGGASSPSANITAKELAAIRKEETLNAAKILGVESSHVLFLNYPDNAIRSQQEDIAKDLSALICKIKPTLITAPFHWDKHQDHRTISQAVQSIETNATRLYYPLWFWPKYALKLLWSNDSFKTYRLNAKHTLEIKEQAIRAHASQFKNVTGSKEWDTLDPHIAKMQLHAYELYFALPPKDKPL